MPAQTTITDQGKDCILLMEPEQLMFHFLKSPVMTKHYSSYQRKRSLTQSMHEKKDLRFVGETLLSTVQYRCNSYFLKLKSRNDLTWKTQQQRDLLPPPSRSRAHLIHLYTAEDHRIPKKRMCHEHFEILLRSRTCIIGIFSRRD